MLEAVRDDAGLHLVLVLYIAFAGELSLAAGRTYALFLVRDYVVGCLSMALAAAGLFLTARVLGVLARERPVRPLAAVSRSARQGLSPERAAGLVLYVALAAFMGAFTTVKTLLSDLRPFWADRALSEAGQILHFGQPSWRLLQPLLGHPPITRVIEFCYAPVWTSLLVLGPFFLAVFCRDAALRKQALWAFVLCWIVNGTILAGLYMSAGPAFFAAITGDTSRFGPLLDYLRQVGTEPYSASVLQRHLWSAYLSRSREIGAGISAFPSMHVTMATLWCLIGFRFGRRIGAAATVYAGVIVAGSIHLGWHYALDSYFAIPSAIAIWSGAGLVARLKRPPPAPALASADDLAPS